MIDSKLIAASMGITDRAVRDRAARESWPYTEEACRGGRRRLYDPQALPEDVRRKVEMYEAIEGAKRAGWLPATPNVAVATPDVAPGMEKYAARLEAILKLLEGIEDEGEREVLLADFFARAQNAKQIDELKRTVADLRAAQQKTG